ncbi:choice-of-anchor D domain-containing protein [Mumia zhuanghuii]|uniref:Choice-of-anchor D domain-containing protein n=2 Tax=Nocardioidaceae TaxID=85015 RepID=A0A5Q6S4A2_9ACTN|nr:choice-of-anchor D domain-containing protein [Mumia zhuanghuii]
MLRAARTGALMLATTTAVVAGTLAATTGPAAAASPYTVTSAADHADATPGDGQCRTSAANGAVCTLRAAIQESNASAGADTIRFAIGSGPVTISPTSELPQIIDPVTIDGFSQPGAGTTPIVHLAGDTVGANGDGLRLAAGTSSVSGLVLTHFDVAIFISGPGGNLVTGTYVGIAPDGTTGRGNSFGIVIDKSPDNVIGTSASPNVISGNAQTGITVNGAAAQGNDIAGNRIGTNAAGTAAVANLLGISLLSGALDTRIGGTTDADGNLVSGNVSHGIEVAGAAKGTVISRNRIGTNAAGTAKLPNRSQGIAAITAAKVTIQSNLISGNGETGVWASGLAGSDPHLIADNLVGTNAAGTAALDNVSDGIRLSATGDPSVPTAYAKVTGNTISGNGRDGIRTADSGYNDISDNTIGLAKGATTTRVPNKGVGVLLVRDRRSSVRTNVVSGNDGGGVFAVGGHTGNPLEILNNRVGTDGTGGSAAPNKNAGIKLTAEAAAPTAGAYGDVRSNLVSGNDGDGIVVAHGMSASTITDNTVGANLAKTGTLRNQGVGIWVEKGSGHDVGTPGHGNLVVANSVGILVRGSSHVSVAANTVGVLPSGAGAPNRSQGVKIDGGATKVTIGSKPTDAITAGSCTAACNTITDNTGAGVAIEGDDATTAVTVRGNVIDKNGGIPVDLGTAGPTPNDAADADTGPNGLLNFPVGVSASYDKVKAKTFVTGVLTTPDPKGAVVDVYKAAGPGPVNGFGTAKEWVGKATSYPTAAGAHFVLELAGDQTANATYSATVTTSDGSTSEVSMVCLDTDGDGTLDDDGDAICDSWETSGIDYDGDRVVDLPLNAAPYGADPTKPDVYVDVDYMEGALHSDRPSTHALGRVVKAYEFAPNNGIALHLSPGAAGRADDAVEHSGDILVMGRGSGDDDDYWDLKDGTPGDLCDGAFGTKADRTGPRCHAVLGAKRLIYRYALFTHRFDESPRTSGVSDLGGQDVLVSIGSWDDDDVVSVGGTLSRCVTLEWCKSEVEAGTFMHELGHALGLDHGGGDDVQNKPNYLSVMNYTFQLLGSTPDRPLDYSRWKLPTLFENNLDEAAGIAANESVATKAEISRRWSATAFSWYDAAKGECVWRSGSPIWAIDWNQVGGAAQTGVAAGIAADGRGGTDCLTARSIPLAGHDDWANLRYDMRSSGWYRTEGVPAAVAARAGAARSGQDVEDAAALATASDSDGDGVPNATDVCVLKADPAQLDQDADGIGDACVDDITDRDVSVSVTAPTEQPPVGSTATVRVTASNSFPLPATDLEIEVRLPEGLVPVSATPSQGSYDAGSGTWTIPSLAKRSSATLDLAVRVTRAETDLDVEAEVVAAGEDDRDSVPDNGDPLEDDLASGAVRAKLVYTLEALPKDVVGAVRDGETIAMLSRDSAGTRRITLEHSGRTTTLPVASDNLDLLGVNAHGEIVYWLDQVSYLWRDGAPVRLPEGFVATALNDAGTVVGRSYNKAATWIDGTVTLLPDLDPTHPSAGGTATAINDDGLIVGYSLSRFGRENAVRWENGGIDSMGMDPGDVSMALDVADGGAIAGELMSRPLRVVDRKRTVIEEGPGRAESVNAVGDFVGRAQDLRAFVHTSGKAWRLEALVAPGQDWFHLHGAMDIADDGSILGVGEYRGELRMFVARVGAGARTGGVTADPGSVDVGVVELGSSSDATEVTFTNTSSAAVQVEAPRLEGAAAADFAVDGGTLPRTLAAGESVEVSVEFTPTAAGTRTASLVVPASNGDVTVPLRGEGVAADDTAPSITCAKPSAAWSRADVSVSCTATDGGSGLANPADGAFVLRTSVAAGTATADAATASRRVCDKAGNCATAGPVRGVRVDKRAPSARAARGAAVTLDGRAVVRLSGADVGSGVASYDTRVRTVARSGGTSGWSVPKGWQASRTTTLTRAVAAGTTACFSTRARDRAGNVSAWSATVCTSAPYDDRALKASAGWKRAKGAAYLQRTISTTTRKGATLKTGRTRGGAIALVVTRCKGCGTVDVLVGKRRIARVTLSGAGTRHRQVVVLPRRAFAGPITIKTVTKGKSVRIDGVAVLP